MFIHDRDGRLTFYRNVGSMFSPSFVLASIGFQNVDPGSWFKFADIDRDGDADLFAGGSSATVNFYRNNGSRSSPNLALEVVALKDTSGSVILSESISVPTFADMDGDGDLDFFSGNSIGSIWYYENVGTQTTFRFRFVTDRYQNIIIIGAVGKTQSRAKRLHGAMAITFADIDIDGDLDLFWGDFFNPSLYFLENRGTSTNPQLVLVDSTFADEAPVQSTGFNMPSMVDIDADGRLDLFIGVLSGATSLGNFFFYQNFGTPAAHQFQLQTTNFLPSVDVGSASSPVFADVDADGDLDLLIGSEDGKLALYEREGTTIFRFITNSYLNLSGLFNVSPTFANLDSDGKLELIVGEANGRLRLYRSAASWSEDTTFQLRSANFGQNASPWLVDINADGKLDLFVGTGDGRVTYYHNDGTSTAPNFSRQTDFFLSADVGDDAKPVFVDFDNDGDFDFVIGARDGRLHYWRNNGNRSSFLFEAIENFFSSTTGVLRSAPSFFDSDGDGDQDLILGNVKGGLYYYCNLGSVIGARPSEFMLKQNYPNPFNIGTMIHYDLPAETPVALKVFNILGQEVANLVDGLQSANSYHLLFEGKGLTSGVYFYRLVAGNSVNVKKMVLIR